MQYRLRDEMQVAAALAKLPQPLKDWVLHHKLEENRFALAYICTQGAENCAELAEFHCPDELAAICTVPRKKIEKALRLGLPRPGNLLPDTQAGESQAAPAGVGPPSIHEQQPQQSWQCLSD